MLAVCQADEFQATALAKSSAGTRLATSAPEAGPKKARAMPNRASTAKIGPAPLNPRMVSSRIAKAQNASRKTGKRHDQPAAEAVGGGARHQHQQQRRQELDDADEAEIERIAGEVVDLPADGDRDDLRRKGREEPRRQIAQEGAMAESGIALVGDFSGHGKNSAGPSGVTPWSALVSAI